MSILLLLYLVCKYLFKLSLSQFSEAKLFFSGCNYSYIIILNFNQNDKVTKIRYILKAIVL